MINCYYKMLDYINFVPYKLLLTAKREFKGGITLVAVFVILSFCFYSDFFFTQYSFFKGDNMIWSYWDQS